MQLNSTVTPTKHKKSNTTFSKTFKPDKTLSLTPNQSSNSIPRTLKTESNTISGQERFVRVNYVLLVRLADQLATQIGYKRVNEVNLALPYVVRGH